MERRRSHRYSKRDLCLNNIPWCRLSFFYSMKEKEILGGYSLEQLPPLTQV